MKISLNWLKEFIDLPESVDQISQTLTATGLEVEGLETFEEIEGGLEGIVVGEVISCKKHSDADKLKVTTVDVGEAEFVPIVCGAPNVAAGQKVLVATVNTTLYPSSGDPFKIKKAKIRGEVSQGMICAEDEIGLGHSHDGIMVLETELPNGTPAADYLELETDKIFEIGLTPNRADATSHLGTARDLKAAFGRNLKAISLDDFEIDNNEYLIDVEVENKEACPRYSGLTISGLKVSDSPKWLKNRLKSIGIAPINNVVDSTNYVLHSIGQPMHAFDADKIKGNKIVVKTMPDGTKFTTLDEKERVLKSSDLMICDQSDGMCIAGVFGGIYSGVSNQTKNIFIESAYFSADSVRKTAMVHGLKTDASFRFERGTDPNNTLVALKYCASLIKKIAGGKISSEIVDIYDQPIENVHIAIKYKNVNRLIGIEIPKDRIREILVNLDISILNETKEGFDCKVPLYRVDVTREADVIEEILRVYGYDNIVLEETYGAETLASFPKPDKDKVQERTSSLLASIGFNEIITNSLTNPNYLTEFENWDEKNNVYILNKLSEELGIMRQTMIFSGLESLKYNINRKQKNLRFFEFGRSYHLHEDQYKEKQYLSLFLSGNKDDENWNIQSSEINFHELSAVVYKILNKFLIKEITSRPTSNPVFDYGLDLFDNDKKLVSLGVLRHDILKKGEVNQSVFYAEFEWKKILKYSGKKISYQPVSKFPEVKRDLSLVIDKKITFDQIMKLAKQENRKLIKKINVFSVYEGENIGEDKKSYALSFILQDEFKTLTDKQIDKTMNCLISSFEENLNAIIRK